MNAPQKMPPRQGEMARVWIYENHGVDAPIGNIGASVYDDFSSFITDLPEGFSSMAELVATCYAQCLPAASQQYEPQEVRDLYEPLKKKLEHDRARQAEEEENQRIEAMRARDDVARSVVNVANCAPDSILMQYAENVADAARFPRATTALMALGVFSAAAATARAVAFEDGQKLPLGLYVAGEQPPSSGKSRVLERMLNGPIQERREHHNNKILDRLREVAKAKTQQPNGRLTADDEEADQTLYTIDPAVTDINSASLDRLCSQQRGYFSIISSEQTAFDTLTGTKSEPESKEIILKGFTGDYVSTHRITRNGMRGNVFGAVAVLAQHNVIDAILGSSNGTGLAERFLFVCEPHIMGSRKKRSEAPPVDQSLRQAFSDVCTWLVDESIKVNPQSISDQPALTICSEGWQLIYEYQDDIEPLLADGAKYGSSVMRGVAGKSDLQIIKIAALLHLASRDRQSMEISRHHVEQALTIVTNLTDTTYRILIDREVIGKPAEFAAIENIKALQDGKWQTERQIIQSRSKVEPFKSASNKSNAIRYALNDMHEKGLLQMMIDRDRLKYRLPM